MENYPLVNIQKNDGTSPCYLMANSTISMAIFNSYVKLLEGKSHVHHGSLTACGSDLSLQKLIVLSDWPPWVGKGARSWSFITPEKLLVGGIPTPLKNMKVSWDDELPFPTYGKIKFMSSHHQADWIWNMDPNHNAIHQIHQIHQS